MEPNEPGSAALAAPPDGAQAGLGDALLEPSRGATEVSPFAAEVHAWRASRGPRVSDTWEVSRRTCAVWAVLIPVLVMVINAAVLLFAASRIDPEQQSLMFAVVTAFWLGFSLLAAREFALLAIFGGGLSATPDGVRFWFGRRSMLLPWSDIESVAVEQQTDTKGGSYAVLAIRFLEGDYRWPWAFSLWSSKPHRLCVSPYILADPAHVVADGLAASLDQHSDAASRESRKASEPAHVVADGLAASLDQHSDAASRESRKASEPAHVVADGLAASLDQHSDAASRESRKASKRGPRRHLALRIVSIAVCLFIVATSLYWIPQKLAASDWVNLVFAVLFLLVAGGLAIGFWIGGDAFYEAIFPDE